MDYNNHIAGDLPEPEEIRYCPRCGNLTSYDELVEVNNEVVSGGCWKCHLLQGGIIWGRKRCHKEQK